MKAFRLHAFGEPADFRLEDVETPTPGAGELLIRQTAVGVNFAESKRLAGQYPGPPLPAGLGLEGAGVVEAVGPGVTGFTAGDRVVAIGGGFSYAEQRLAPAARTAKLPAGVSEQTAAAAFAKGLTAAYLVEGPYHVKAGDTVLVHAAAGGVGQILSQWAKALGARVIGTVGSEPKTAYARAHGCDEVINYSTEDFVARTRELTDGKGVNVVYDSVGKDTAIRSLDCLRPRGTLVIYGAASGPIPPLDTSLLVQKGSLAVTRTSMPHYVTEDAEFQHYAQALFDKIASGAIKVDIDKVFPFTDAPKALAEIAGRGTMGALVLAP